MEQLFDGLSYAIFFVLYAVISISTPVWRDRVAERRREAAFAAALGEIKLSPAAKRALKLLFFPAGGDGWRTLFSGVGDPPGEYSIAELEWLVSPEAVEELERAGLVVRGGTPLPVPVAVAKLYPSKMRRSAERSTSAELVFLTQAGWALHPACRPETVKHDG